MIPFAFVALAASEAHAEPSYRAVDLADGRAFVAEVLGTDAGGLRARVPQGTLAIPFDLLRDMRPTDAAAFESQPRWSVHVAAPDAVRDDLVEALGALPAVEAWPIEEPGGGLSPEAAARGAACGLDVDCIVDAWSGESWRFVVVALREGDALRVVGAVSTGAVLHREDLREGEGFEGVAPALLGLDAPAVLTAPLAASTPFPQRSGPGWSFAPVPGLPALRRGDHAAFVTALGIAVPTTALWVGAVGRNAQSAPEAVALGLAGFYVSTVVANELTDRRGRSRR